MPESFDLKMALNTVHATVDDAALTYKIGMSKRTVALSAMRHLYIVPGSVRQLVISYDHAGKLKRVTIGANDGQPAFDALVDAILARRPEIDIRHLPAKEANALLGRSRALIFLGGVVALAVGLGVWFWVSGALQRWLDG
ncbi:MAG: hypothetical protein ACI9U2_001816 [Bradymonadia bacterium]|jgi:hypothetical protein